MRPSLCLSQDEEVSVDDSRCQDEVQKGIRLLDLHP